MPVTINGSNTPTAGGVTYGDGTQYATTSAGTSGQVLLSGGAGAPTWGAAPGATFNEFTSTGTWTKPSGATFVMVECWGGGAGGGSGRRGATSTNRLGGSGGGGGAYTQRLFKASDLSSTVSITIGAGGTGGAAQTSDSTTGNNGTNGGNTTFGAYLTAFGGGYGRGGPNTGPVTYGGAGGGVLTAGNGSSSGGEPSAYSVAEGQFGTGGAGSYGSSGWGGGRGGQTTDYDVRDAGGCSFQGGPGGGVGGLIASDNSTWNASAGGSITGVIGGGGAGGAAGTAGTAGSGRQGGGGGGYGSSGAGGAGGAGGQPGGGGGGGGASLNGNNSGTGGAGGAGLCRVYTW